MDRIVTTVERTKIIMTITITSIQVLTLYGRSMSEVDDDGWRYGESVIEIGKFPSSGDTYCFIYFPFELLQKVSKNYMVVHNL